jgi:hypothetical protein
MQPAHAYEIGQSIILEGKSTLAGGVAIEPVSPRILLRDPNGNETTLAVTLGQAPGGTGTWSHVLYLTGPPGMYVYRLTTSTDAEEQSFYVLPSEFQAPLG